MARYSPRRGDLIWLHFDPQAGHEQAGRRPGMVISHDAYNAKVGLALVCPITTAEKGYPFEVRLPSGLVVQGVVLADQVRSLDWHARKAKLIATLPAETMDEILGKLETLLAR